MKFRQHAIAAAVSVLLSAVLTPVVSADAATAEPSAEALQPAQTQEAVVTAKEEGVGNALRDVEKTAQQFVLEQRKRFRKQGRGNEIFIASGSALISQPMNSPDWGDARVIAYQEAQSKARESFLKELYAQVSSEIIRESFSTNQLPEFTPEELQAQGMLESLLDKMAAYSNAVLDSKLEENGINPA